MRSTIRSVVGPARVAAAAALLLSAHVATAQEEIDGDLTVFKVSAHRAGSPAGPDVLQYRISWPDGTKVDFTLGDQPKSADAGPPPIRLSEYNSTRLVIYTDPTYYIVNARTGELVDRFGAYKSQISPDGRYIVYERETSNGVLLTDAVYLLYDLARPPSENRMSNSGAVDAGIAVYPTENRTEGAYTVPRDLTTAHERMSPFVWLTPTAVAVVDRVANDVTVVFVDLAEGSSRMKVLESRVDPSSILNSSDSRLQSPGSPLARFLRVDSMALLTNTPQEVTVHLFFSSNFRYIFKTLDWNVTFRR
jgi:hypothetical protein